MKIFISAPRLSFVLLALSLAGCGEYIIEEGAGKEGIDKEVEEVVVEVEEDYEFVVSGDTLSAPLPKGADPSNLTYEWLIYGEVVSESAIFDTSAYSIIYPGEHTVTLSTTDGQSVYVASSEVDFNTESDYEFSFSEGILTATPPDSIDASSLTYQWSIDGNIVSDSATFDTLTSLYSGKQTVTLNTFDGSNTNVAFKLVDFGAEATNQSPVASFTFLNDTLTATSTDDAGSDSLTHTWFVGNESLGNGAILNTSDLTGTLTIKLVSTDAENLSNSKEESIDFGIIEPINSAPIAIATSNVTAGFIPLTVTFDASKSTDNEDSTLAYSWDFGDGTSSTLARPSKVFNTAGNHKVTLTVKDASNVSNTAEVINITAASPAVDLPPVASFTMNTAKGDAPFAASFNASASSDDNGIASYSWNFGDSSATATGITASHVYNKEGVYTATLTVIDDAGQSTKTTTQVTVEAVVDLKPIASFSMNATTGDAPFAASFNASASSDDNDIASYSWDFGDGNATDSGVTANHTYDTEGVYTATLTVTDDAGQSTKTTTQVTVEAVIDLKPIASFSMNAATGDAPFAASFNASASSDDNGIASYSWNFGDDSAIGTGVTTSHRYDVAGVYTVTLTVTDDASQSTQTTTQVTVTEVIDLAPVASFTTSSTTGDAPFVTSFNASASSDDNGIVSYSWDFGDGSATKSGVTSTYTYTEAGAYTATLTVSDSSNQIDVVTQRITVTSAIPPTASFITMTSGLNVTVDATASIDAKGDNLTYAWTFMNERGATVATATGVTATYDFATAGAKSIRLIVSNSGLLADDLTQTITVESDDEVETANGEGTIIFSEDYEDQTAGRNPDGWGVNIGYNIQMNPNATQYADKVRVVDNAPGRSGKALYVDGTGLSSSQNYSIMPLDLSVVDGVERVYVRYYMYATTNYIGNRARTPSGAQPNHNHFMSLGLSHQTEMRIGEIKGALGANEYGADDIVPKAEYWYGQKETARMDAGTWYCVETAFINDGATPVLRTWLDNVLVTEVDEASDWKNGAARNNWLDGFFGGVQLGWGNFSTYDNELYFDDVIASNERIGCDVVSSELAPVLTPSFDIDEDAMFVMVDGSASTGSEDFTYEWNFNGEFTDTTSGSNASYTFTTAGDKTISLTLSSGDTTETITRVITIVDTVYDDLLAKVAGDVISKSCTFCHNPQFSNRPIVFTSTAPADVEIGMTNYIANNSAQQLIDVPNGIGHLGGKALPAGTEDDWEALVNLIDARMKSEDSGATGSLGNGNIMINDDFEGQTANSVPQGWKTFLSYQIDMSNNNASNGTFALIDSSMAHSGSNSIRIKTGGNTIQPAFIFQDLPEGSDAYYSRAWMYIPTALGGGAKGSDSKHAHFMSYSTEMSGSNKEELRYGTIQDGILGAFLPRSIDAGTENIVPTTEIPANEWVCVEFAMIKGNTFDQTIGWVGGDEIFNAKSASDWARNPGQFFSDDTEIANHVTFGWRAFGDNKGVENIWFDDIVVSDKYIGCN